VAAGDIVFPSVALIEDASGGLHPGFIHDGQRWNSFGTIVLAETELTSAVTVPAGTTVTVTTISVNYAGVGKTCEIVCDMPMVDFVDTSGGEAVFIVTDPAGTHAIGHMHGDRSLGWPARFGQRLPIAGAGVVTYTLSCQSVSGNVTLRGDGGVLYGPIALSVSVVA
jgi:hypothetical protein